MALAGCASSASSARFTDPTSPPAAGGAARSPTTPRRSAAPCCWRCPPSSSRRSSRRVPVRRDGRHRRRRFHELDLRAGPARGAGPGLYVYAVPAGAEVEYLGDDWAPETVTGLSGDLPVTVVSDPDGQVRSVVSIDASPAGVVRLIGDGVPREELIAMAGRLLDGLA
ncbi:hypothetical protein NKG05_17135 [Oerskovia sp. M15]